MEQILKYYRTAHAYAHQGDYNDAIEYLKQATAELTRVRPRENMQSDPYQQGQFRYLQETFANEIKHLEQYLKTLQVLDDFRFASRLERCPGEQQWSAKQHMPQAVVHARELPQNTPVTPSFGAPRAAPVPAKPSRASKAPNAAKIGSRRPAGNNVPAKVNSNRPTPEAKKTQKDTEPWESWEGQDKELASNLSNDIMDASPGVRWDDIAGLQDAKRILQEAMVLPLLRPELFVGIRKPVKGVLLFGPPGTGKTLLARALATECDTTFFTVSSSTLASKWRGESERMVRVMFAMAYSKAPATIFIDEVDALCSSRGGGDNEASRRVKTEMLVQVQINGIQSGSADGGRVMVMGATNFPWDLDEALRRRLEKRIYIPLPAAPERKQLLHINLKGVDVADDCDFDKLADMGEGYSGDDITNVCREAAMNGLRRIIDGKDMSQIKAMDQGSIQEPVRMEDFLQAFDKVRPSVGKEEIIKHEQWRDEYGST